MLYRWWIFLHIVGVFGFLLSHGVSTGVAFKLRKERDPVRIQALLELSGSSMKAFYASLLLLLLGGVVAGFQPGIAGSWWGQGWIWTSLGLLVGVSVAMYLLATTYYKKVRLVATERAAGSKVATEERLAEVLESPRPLLVAAIGFAALGGILYLMMFKPF